VRQLDHEKVTGWVQLIFAGLYHAQVAILCGLIVWQDLIQLAEHEVFAIFVVQANRNARSRFCFMLMLAEMSTQFK
jgi:hypothetical protein